MQCSVFGSRIDIDDSYLDGSPDTIRRQVREYEAGERRTFDCSVAFPATYTGRVMRAIAAIPYAETRTYGELATEIDSGPRAVGGACGRNPVPVVVPCHRVVRADGGLGGYSASGGVALKARLIEHEARRAGREAARVSRR